jgi:hypothetical protein
MHMLGHHHLTDQTKSRRIAHSSRQRESMRERREPVIPTEVGRFFLALGL